LSDRTHSEQYTSVSGVTKRNLTNKINSVYDNFSWNEPYKNCESSRPLSRCHNDIIYPRDLSLAKYQIHLENCVFIKRACHYLFDNNRRTVLQNQNMRHRNLYKSVLITFLSLKYFRRKSIKTDKNFYRRTASYCRYFQKNTFFPNSLF